jgi:hypothetical protein
MRQHERSRAVATLIARDALPHKYFYAGARRAAY